MSITRRVTLLLLIVFAVCTLSIYTVIRQSMLPAFGKLDEDMAAVNQSRIEEYLRSEHQLTRDFAANYAYWEDTYLYMQGKNPGFAEANFNDSQGIDENLSVFMLMDSESQVVTSATWGGELGDSPTLAEIIPNLEELLPVLRRNGQFETIDQGIFTGATHPLLFSALPIVDADRQMEPMGFILYFTVLNDYFIEVMRERISIDGDILSGRDSSLQSLRSDPGVDTKQVGEVLVVEGDNELRQYRQYRDVFGNPAFLTEVRTSRTVLRFGEDTIASVLFLQLILLLVVITALWKVLDRFVISRIKILQEHITTIKEEDDLSRRIEVVHEDEVGRVAKAFNKLTAALQQSREESESAKEAALRAAEVKSQFLANMSHEIKTPMNGLMGLIFLLKESPYDQTQLEYLNLASDASESLMEILNDILDVSKIDANKVEMESVEVNVYQHVEGVIDLLSGSSAADGLELCSFFDANVPIFIKSDPTRLRQVLSNLLSNALKFTSEGHVTVHVEKADAQRLRFSVSDTGIGMEPSAQASIFQSFTQADDSTTRQYGGTGLGLSLCKRLVDLLGGEIGVKSAPGKGSTFWFTVKFEDSERGATTLTLPDRLRSLRVLLSTDCQLTVQHVKHCLKELRFAAPETISTTRLGMVDLAKFDCIMVEPSEIVQAGDEIANLRKVVPSKVRIIAVLSREQIAYKEVFRQAGFDAILMKPLGALKLIKSIVNKSTNTEKAAKSLGTGPQLGGDQVKRHILLVEDNIVNQKVAAGMLKRLGCEVELAENGQVACELLLSNSYDLVLMDCQMPVLGGLEATRRIRERELKSGAKPQPIVAMTAHSKEAHKRASKAAGMDDHISKPLNIADLKQVLSAWA